MLSQVGVKEGSSGRVLRKNVKERILGKDVEEGC